MKWEFMNGGFPEMLGFLPMFLSELDERPAAEQFDANYAHGGGWRPNEKWSMKGEVIQYPGDPALRPVAKTQLRDETILVYPYAFVAVVQKDGSFEIARMD
jgi:hypothetical protein